jgi:EpsI family protein
MNARVLVLVVLVTIAGVLRLQTAPVDVIHAGSLTGLPMVFGEWQGRRGADYAPNVVAALGVDEYVNRGYVASGGRSANLYVGYYRSQEQGASIHSPLNCLPGAGWEPETVSRIPFARGSARLVIVRKGAQRLMVLYWYQTATRIEGDEYRGRFYTVVDTLKYGRNDAALVRVTVPIPLPGDEGTSIRKATELAALVQPEIDRALFPKTTL